MKRWRCHFPSCTSAFACGMRRAAASMSAMVCSAAEMMFEAGALQTMTSCSAAASRSMLSTVTPARPMIFRFSAASSKSLVTRVADRTISAS